MSKECSKKIQVTEYDNTNSNSQTETFDVFISYRRKTGRDIARLLQQTLRNRGYKVFFDYDSLRDDVFDQRIENAIKSAKVLILVMTQGILDTCMNENDWIRKEIDLAKKYGVKIVPIAPTDKEWTYPQEMPWPDLKYLQVSVLDIGALFDASIDKILQDRFPTVNNKPNLQKNTSAHTNEETFAKIFTLGLLISGKSSAALSNKIFDADTNLEEIMSELKIPVAINSLIENKFITNVLDNQMWCNNGSEALGYINETIQKLYDTMGSNIFMFGFLLPSWTVLKKSSTKTDAKTKITGLMHKIALPEVYINRIISIKDINDTAECIDALFQHFKHHLEHTKECPNCFARIADDYSQCPVCKTILKKRKMIFSFLEAIKSLFR